MIPHGQVHKGSLVHNRTDMGECLEALFSMITAHAAAANTAEPHVMGRQVDDGIIDTATPEGAPVQNLLLYVRALRE